MSGKSWSCQRCTFLNEYDVEKCKVCDFTNPQKKDPTFFQKRLYFIIYKYEYNKETIEKFFILVSSMFTTRFDKLDLALDLFSSQIYSPHSSFNVTADWCCPNCTNVSLANIRLCHLCGFDRQNGILLFFILLYTYH